MRGKLEKGGHYELFLTTKGHRILNLNNKSWFVIVKGREGEEMLVRSDADHEKDRTGKEGRFYLTCNNDDPELSEIPHLLLEEGNKFRKWALPDDGPVGQDYQKKPVKAGNTLYKTAQRGLVSGHSRLNKEQLVQPLEKK